MFLSKARDRYAVSLIAFPWPFRYVGGMLMLFGVMFVSAILCLKAGLGEFLDPIELTIILLGSLFVSLAIGKSYIFDAEFAAKANHEEVVRDEDIISVEEFDAKR